MFAITFLKCFFLFFKNICSLAKRVTISGAGWQNIGVRHGKNKSADKFSAILYLPAKLDEGHGDMLGRYGAKMKHERSPLALVDIRASSAGAAVRRQRLLPIIWMTAWVSPRSA